MSYACERCCPPKIVTSEAASPASTTRMNTAVMAAKPRSGRIVDVNFMVEADRLVAAGERELQHDEPGVSGNVRAVADGARRHVARNEIAAGRSRLREGDAVVRHALQSPGRVAARVEDVARCAHVGHGLRDHVKPVARRAEAAPGGGVEVELAGSERQLELVRVGG